MWEAISGILTDQNTWQVLFFCVFLVVAVILSGKSGLIAVKTKGIRIGVDEREREIIRQQVEWAHSFITSLRSKINLDEMEHNEYFAKYILERCYDKAVEWITFNHLNTKNVYVEIKQEEMCALVYGLGVGGSFKSPEFRKRICAWTRELIERLVQIREVYAEWK